MHYLRFNAKHFFSRKGQSLIEILLAVTVGGILLVGVVSLINIVLQSGRQNVFFQNAALLNQDMMDKVRSYAERQWYCDTETTCGLYNLSKTPDIHSVQEVSGILEAVLGALVSDLGDGVMYATSFVLQNVCRDDTTDVITINLGPSQICSGNETEDPSTQFVTVITGWTFGGQQSSLSLSSYVTRSKNRVFHQTNWDANGGSQDYFPGNPRDDVNDQYWYADPGAFDFTTSGELKLKL
ncbi:MAG: hypothetical protein COU08_01280 [Candidatus Harrisonbacteria bacterium CG10_big_fil_rev_8_21_14_0_10_42_17]|uniref:Uncharacterized protein n=1 Tax=Candidatus Harrisonbacteria bacterium CG10_big_fil_rev_8_21_14_0_10_42_17 TaxID=1974584 RepID=A0A2M6WII1_9BACT|nr:MAG: hypothetical protein COU08_01280 [Candidatus Harrisonbacteria bacterium CG10_big_fil_rev_8_21_14_0_10_42_17]